MGKLFDKFRKYASDNDFDQDYFEDAFEELEEIEEVDEIDELEEAGESVIHSEVEFEEPDEIDGSEELPAEEELDEELDDSEELPAEEELEEELDDSEEFATEEELEEELDDSEELAAEEAFEEELDDSEELATEEELEDEEDEQEQKFDRTSQEKSDKPTPAELIAAFYQEEEPVKKKKKKYSKQENSSEQDTSSTQDNQFKYDEEEDDATIRRRERRKRRIRNQILAYVITLAVLSGLLAGGYFGGRAIWNQLKPKAVETTEDPSAVEEALDDLAESEEEIVIEAPESMDEEPEPTVEDYLEEIVEACISAMPIEDKVAQLFMVTPESLTGASKATQAGEKTQEALTKYRVGGFVYSGDNLVDKEQITNMLSATAGYNLYDMFLAIDEEGGKTAPVQKSKIEVPEVVEMGEVGATGDPIHAYEAGKTIGQYLRELGFNMDLAPVADVVTSSEKTTIGSRSFGPDSAVVGQMVQKCAEGIQENGVSACLKHFPGLGDTTTDTKKERVVIEKSLEELQANDFAAFKAAIDAGVDFVMVSHATATGIDEVYPSSLSKKVITEQLRDYLGYDGIVITDAFNMKAITEYYTTEEACVKAIKAGADMILMPENFEAGYNAVLEAVKDGSISEERIDDSLKRIFRVKKRDEIVK